MGGNKRQALNGSSLLKTDQKHMDLTMRLVRNEFVLRGPIPAFSVTFLLMTPLFQMLIFAFFFFFLTQNLYKIAYMQIAI